ncbi:MAG: BatA domain-containing protein, partial [Planctomycetota bacterium]
MSLLAPLYLIAAAAVAIPILVHLIRRRPKAEMTFSSLMFLRESPPKLTKRSRLDDWPLLLMRALALMLMAMAFARPFFRSEDMRSSKTFGRRLVLMIDTSASMRRSGIDLATQNRVGEFVDSLRPDDAVAVLTFDRETQVALDFVDSARLDEVSLKQTLRDIAKRAKPTWRSSDLGQALAFASEWVGRRPDIPTDAANESVDRPSVSVSSENTSDSLSLLPTNLVVITDLQVGSSTTVLQSLVWPDELNVDFQLVSTDSPTNAAARLLQAKQQDLSTSQEPVWKVRVSNAGDSDRDDFRLAWGNGDGSIREDSVTNVIVPPGQSLVIKVPPPEPGDNELILKGDDQEFDNVFSFVPLVKRQLRFAYIGESGDDPRDDPAYFLKQIPLGNSQRDVDLIQVQTMDSNAVSETLKQAASDVVGTPLVCLASPIGSAHRSSLRDYIRRGGRILIPIGSAESYDAWEETLATIDASIALEIDDASVK